MRQKNNNDDFIIFLTEETAEMADKILPDPTLLNYYNRLSRREILINTVVDERLIDVAKQIFEWNKEDKDIPIEEREKIKIYINTDGGCANTTSVLVSAIQLSKTPVITIGLGKCFSAGALILIAPKPENRYILPSTMVMIHKGSARLQGDISKIIDYSELFKKEDERVKKFVLTQTKIPEAEYTASQDKDWFFFAEDCVKYGICENIITDIDQINSF
jgi:ATP-dependent Clp protease protease subunit